MADKKEPIDWITVFGNHIPIYAGQSTDDAVKSFINKNKSQDDKNKERQIAENKKEADEKNEKEDYVGKHTVYRAGDLSGSGTGFIYFATDKETADRYGKSHTYTSQGKKYTTGKRETKEYEVNVKKPLVVESDDDVNCAIRVYNRLHPNRQVTGVYDKNLMRYAKEDGYKITGGNALQFYLDKANAQAMKGSGYDALVYKTYNVKEHRHTYSQLIIPAGSVAIKEK